MGRRREPGERVDRIARGVIGAAIEVHRSLGPGFLESVYEEALCLELSLRALKFERQFPIAVSYKGARVGQARLDLVVDGALVVELKTVDVLVPIHVAQVLSYLKATKLELGLLLNFNAPILRDGMRRVVATH